MKTKSLLVAGGLLMLSSVMFAQKTFQNGSNIISGGIGVGGLKWKGVSFGVSYERGVTDNIGVGLHLGYSEYSKNGYTYKATITGAKGSYHFLTTDRMDPYAGGELGYVSISRSGFNETIPYHSYPHVGLGLYGGIRYYLTPGIGVYGELRLSTFAVVCAGVSLKL